MTIGDYPFTAPNDLMLYNKIKKGTYTIPEDNQLSSECISLISGLLKINPQERLSASEVLNHPWFNGKVFVGPTINPDPLLLANYLRLDKLQKLVIAYIASHTSDHSLIMVMNTFVSINVSKTGVISKEELNKWIIDNTGDESLATKAFVLMDINQSKGIEYLGNHYG